MKRTLLAAASLAALAAAAPAALASSHREAPMITQTPKLDGTDFYMFRSYEPGRSGFVTMIANYIPLQDVYGGPNFFNLDHEAYYDINIDNTGSGTPNLTFRFRFTQTDEKLALNIDGHSVPVPVINIGPVTDTNNSNQNVIETYTVSLLTNTNGVVTEQPLTNAANGSTVFTKPLDNIGHKSIPHYPDYAAAFIYNVNIPGCGAGRLFVGQRKDPFVVNLAETFDLINYAHPVGEQYDNSARDDLADKNVTSLAMEVPIACLSTGGDPVVGAWTTASKGVRGPSGAVTFTQLSRLGNPLVNEVLIGLPDKDRFNTSEPVRDSKNFDKYFSYPTLPAIIQELFGTAAPTAFPRRDLRLVFLLGIPGLNAPASLVAPAEEMRLNTSIPVTPYGSQSRLGVIGGDNAGYPNGRRPGDDVVDISLRVVMGRLYTLGVVGKPSDAPSGNLDFTDGAYTDDTHYLTVFPYARPPLSGSPQHPTD